MLDLQQWQRISSVTSCIVKTSHAGHKCLVLIREGQAEAVLTFRVVSNHFCFLIVSEVQTARGANSNAETAFYDSIKMKLWSQSIMPCSWTLKNQIATADGRMLIFTLPMFLVSFKTYSQGNPIHFYTDALSTFISRWAGGVQASSLGYFSSTSKPLRVLPLPPKPTSRELSLETTFEQYL